MYAMHTTPSKVGVDTHFHVFEAGIGQRGSRYVPAYAARIADWQQVSRAAGISLGVLVQTSFLGTDNRLLLSFAHAFGHRIDKFGNPDFCTDGPLALG